MKLPELTRAQAEACISEITAFLGVESVWDYRPYPKQHDFHALGAEKRNRMLRAGNQNGKTWSAAHEATYHLLGEYPDWWPGYRFDKPITAWCAGETMETTRDLQQALLLGEPGRIGTGLIPKRAIVMTKLARGVADAVDFCLIRNAAGGLSMLKFKNFTQQRRVWQGKPVDLVWWDEEPPEDKHSEGMARTIATQGITMMTFTPLLGMTDVVDSYMNPSPGQEATRGEVVMTIHDALHIPPEKIQAEIDRWPKHQIGARIRGEPMLGEGMIYPFAQEDIECKPFPIPDWFLLIGGVDFGFDHPFAAIKLAVNPETEEAFVVAEYRESEKIPAEHWITLRHWGRNLLYAWPRDGLNKEKGTGRVFADLYKDEGMKMLPRFARYPDRSPQAGAVSIVGDGNFKGGGRRAQPSVSLERGIEDVYARLQQGRLKVFSTCTQWFEEQRLYHRKDGKVVDKRDDLLDATRYAIMMMGSATQARGADPGRRRQSNFDWRAGV